MIRYSHFLQPQNSASKDQDLESHYAALLKQTSSHEKSISRDLSRTFPGHDYFRDPRDGGGNGQENLFNVVKAYSLYDEEVGYTQGLQFIVGPLLLNVRVTLVAFRSMPRKMTELIKKIDE